VKPEAVIALWRIQPVTNDQLKSLCESNAKAIQSLASATATALQQTNATLDRTAQQQATNTTGIDDLLGVVVTHETELQRVLSAIDESNRRFDILREEAIADRKRADSQFQAMQENIRNLFVELHSTNRRVDTLESR